MSLGFRVLPRVGGPERNTLERFMEYSSADVSDAMNKAGTMFGIRHAYIPVPRIVGTAVTASLPTGSLQIMKMAMNRTKPGDILVVTACGNVSHAVWGGNLSRGMKRRGVLGIIVDGAARDIPDTQAVGFPVFCRGIATASSSPSGPGEVNVPIACGGVVVNPGDIVIADEEGVAVIPQAGADVILVKLEELKARQAGLQPTLERGEVTNIDNIVSELRSAGCEIDQ